MRKAKCAPAPVADTGNGPPPELDLPIERQKDLTQVLENLDLLSTSEAFIKKLEQRPGGSIEYAQKQIDAALLLLHDWMLICGAARFTSNNPLVHDLAIERAEALGRTCLRLMVERQGTAKLLALVPHNPGTDMVLDDSHPRLLSLDDWMQEFEKDGKR